MYQVIQQWLQPDQGQVIEVLLLPPLFWALLLWLTGPDQQV
jgi:hypothetical protein